MTFRIVLCLILIQFLIVTQGQALSLSTGMNQNVSTGYESDPPLLHKANIIGDSDDRMFSTDSDVVARLILNQGTTNQYILTQSDLKQFRQSVGVIQCANSMGKKTKASGALIGSNQVLTTTKHSFVDIVAPIRPVDLNSCIFENFEGEVVQILFSEADQKSLKRFFENRTHLALDEDQISVRLASPVQALPFEMDNSAFMANEDFIGVTAFEEDWNDSAPTDPILRKGQLDKVHDNKVFDSVSDLSEGGSGGINLFVRGGRLVAKGVFQGYGSKCVVRNRTLPEHERESCNYRAFSPTDNFIRSTIVKTQAILKKTQ